MSLKIRRILFIIFILAFFIISGLILTYASGYKIALNGKRPLQKTGMLILDTKPKGAKIYLNGKPQQEFINKILNKEENFITTPAKIKNLLPGEYNVRMELNGYWAWEKKLEVKGGVSTFAEDVNLFKKNLPLLIKNSFGRAQIFQNNKYIISLADNSAFIYNTKNEDGYSIKNIASSSVDSVKWSPSGNKFFLGNKLYAIGEENAEIKLSDFIKNEIFLFRWGENDNEIFFIEKNKKNYSVYNFNLLSKKINYLFSESNIIDLKAKNGALYVLKQNTKSSVLNIYKNSSKPERTIELPLSSDYEFKESLHKYIEAYDKKHGILYLIYPDSYFPIEEIISNIKYFSWVNGNRLIYGNDFEIWVNDLSLKSSVLLTRISSEINNILWHPSDNYIIYSTNDSLYSLEMDDREKHSTIEIMKLQKIADSRLNDKGDIIYFYGEIGSQKGLYKMAIQ